MPIRSYLAIGIMLLLLACLPVAATPADPSDCLLVRFRANATDGQITEAHGRAGAQLVGEIAVLRVQVVKLTGPAERARALGYYRNHPMVEYAEPDAWLEPAQVIPNDPYYSSYQRQLSLLQAPAAWELTTGSPEAMVAVLDSGVELSHPDLATRLVAGPDLVQGDSNPSDVYGHGTMVTGVLGAATNNGAGIAGVTWQNPVLVVRIAGDSGSAAVSTMAAGIIYAADHGARAINVSFTTSAYSQTLADAAAYAWGKGAVVVAGAGNYGDGSRPYYPAALPYVVGVAGVEGDVLSPYSNYGSWVDVCAPFTCYSTSMGAGYRQVQGTSFSGPFVTGLLGLIFAANPELTPAEAVEIICSTADDLGSAGFDSQYGWGRINLYRAVAAAGDATPQPPPAQGPTVKVATPADGAAVAGSTPIAVEATDPDGVARVDLLIGGSTVGTLTSAPYRWTWNTSRSEDGPYVLQARALDRVGNRGDSAAVEVTVDNTPPTVNIQQPTAGSTVSGTVTVTAGATDAATAVTQVSFYLDGMLQRTVTAAPYTWQWVAGSAAGTHVLTARARDRAGNEAQSAPVTVQVGGLVTDTFTGRVTFGTSSYYSTRSFTVRAPGVIDARLSFTAGANLDLYLYSPSRAGLAGSSLRTGTVESIRYQAPAAGTYYLVVLARSGGSSYTLTVTHP